MRHALEALPCVEQGSVKVNMTAKEVRFSMKEQSPCEMDEVKKAVSRAGSYRVSAVKSGPAE